MDLMKVFQIHKAPRHQRYYQPTTVKFMNQIDDKRKFTRQVKRTQELLLVSRGRHYL